MSLRLSRRGFLKSAGLGIAATAADPVTTAALGSEVSPATVTTSPAQALKLLREGNRRWVTGHVTHPHQSIKRRLALRYTQNHSRPCSRVLTRVCRPSWLSIEGSVTSP